MGEHNAYHTGFPKHQDDNQPAHLERSYNFDRDNSKRRCIEGQPTVLHGISQVSFKPGTGGSHGNDIDIEDSVQASSDEDDNQAEFGGYNDIENDSNDQPSCTFAISFGGSESH